MQLKGLVRFFTIALILICIYQLSFTWFVHNHETAMEEKAEKWLKANYPTKEQKYPNDATLQALYEDSLKTAKDARLKRLLDSTQDSKIGPFGLTTYRSAKDKELMLGLDLQGGMSVTMEVGLDGLIKSLANFTKDTAFNKAIETAVFKKANSNADLISLFSESYLASSGNKPLAPFFAGKSNSKIKFDDSNDKVVSYLRTQAEEAFNNTLRILRTRIDGFGLASPNINPDPIKGIINIELAGVHDAERVRRNLQSTANLQFFEVYNINEIGDALVSADKSVQDYLNGVSATDTAAKADTNLQKKNEAPIRQLIQFNQPYQGRNGKTIFPAAIGLIQTKDTGLLNSYLRLELVKAKFPANLVMMYGKLDVTDAKAKNILQLYAIKTLDNGQAELEGEHVTQARQDYRDNKVVISMSMDKVGSNIWAKMTARNIDRPIAVVLDNFVYSAPNVNDAITTGNSEISGSYTVKEAQDLAQVLEGGKYTAPAKIVQEQIIGPTLGAEAVKGGSLSFLISFLVIFGLMLVYYNTGGWVANIALILNLLFTVGILSALGFTLTAPGIAGLVLTIGMAVDTNVIIFERIKEELARGKSHAIAINDGYRRSLAPVLDAHITTLLTAVILAYFGLGPVLGFATTQIIGIILSLFCGILVSRLITDMYMSKNRHFNYFTKLSERIFKHASFKFIEYRKIAYGISVVVFLLGIASFFNGFDQGVEFAGGRSYTVKFDKPVKQEDVAKDLKLAFGGESPIIKTVGNNYQLNITTAYKIEESNAENTIDLEVEQALYKGLKNYLPENVSFQDFSSKYKQSSQTVLPTISDDLKAGAAKATIFALIVICLYIFVRFRDWRYSLGTIFALLHDVFVTLIVFSFLRKVVPFPLEIDQHFIAAILTVIGFSMNDTVIVYDRIREDAGLMKTAEMNVVINRAINETLSRTIMTSLTVFLTILILFIFGGEVTRGFAFAMLIGVITGTYSSIFVAAPILVDFAKKKRSDKTTK